jgi:hypothetical protein
MMDAGVSAETATKTGTYHAPQKLLVRCPGCGVTILRGLMIDGRVKKQVPPLTPILGEVHQCVKEETL